MQGHVQTPVAAPLPAPASAAPSTPAHPATALSIDVAADTAPAAAQAAEASPPAPPTYRTSPPPALTLHYTVSRGQRVGDARLDWRLGDDGRYEIELRGAAEGQTSPRHGAATPSALAPHWTSRGTLDAAGIAPDRFAVARRGRERHAANFQREAGIVSYAGPARTWPLAPGAQDRVSWMIQLAAVLQAEPALTSTGQQISMMVVGAHGDADLWTFTALAPERMEGPGGEEFDVVPLHRPARHAHDPQVQVWVAPALHHLPVRLRLTRIGTAESTDFRLRALQVP